MTIRGRTTAVIATTALVVLCGCGSSSSDERAGPGSETTAAAAPSTHEIPSTLPDLDPATLDVDDPDDVAVAVLETMYTYLPAVDNSPNDALLRAHALLNGQMATAAREWQPPTGPGREWQRWATTNTLVTANAAVSPQQRPPDTERALRYMTVQQSTHTEFTTQELAPIHVLVSLEKTSDGWQLASLLQR